MSQITHNLDYRADIDGLRGIAVLAVVLFHAQPAVLPGGYLGVDVFFVVSGYLITLILARALARDEFSLRNFYARRIRRLFPALIIVLLAVLAFGYQALFVSEYANLGLHALYSIVFMLDFRLMQEAGYFDVVSHAKPLLHLWSLSVEEQFYLLCPTLLVVLHKLRQSALVVALLLCVGSFCFAIHARIQAPDAAFFHPLARFWEIGLGAALALNESRGVTSVRAHLGARNVMSLTGLATILMAMLWPRAGVWMQLALMGASVVGATMLIWAGPNSLANRWLRWSVFVFIGLISYPLYLWHWPLLSFVRICESGYPSASLLWMAVGLAVLLAWLTYTAVERPFRFGTVRPRAVAFSLSAMAALLLGSVVIVAASGLPARAAVRYVDEAEALFQRGPKQDQACLDRFPLGKAPVYCRFEHGGDRLLALVGDSHAHALFPGFAATARQLGYSTLLLANSGCPPLDGTSTGRTSAEHKRCAENIERILAEIERIPGIPAAVLVTRGPLYIEGHGFGAPEAHYDYPPLTANAINSIEPGGPAFGFGLEQTIDRLQRSVGRVAYLLQVPELGVSARDCLPRPLVLTNIHGCTVEYRIYSKRMATYRALVKGIKSHNEPLLIVDPEAVFCDHRKCDGFIGGKLLYSDDDHLSLFGSRRVADLVFTSLKGGLAKHGENFASGKDVDP